MAITNTSITVATTATELTGTQSSTNQRGSRNALTLFNNGSVRIYVGGASVTTSLFSFYIDPGQSYTISSGYKGDALPRKRWYACVASSTAPLLISEVTEL